MSVQCAITAADINAAQSAWANGIVDIGRAYTENQNYASLAKDFILKHYAYQDREVLFKPTKASEQPFRHTIDAALSYFVGNNKNFPEDTGFAIQPWIQVDFKNDRIFFHDDIAIAMGIYTFTPLSGESVNVEYTFAYIKTAPKILMIISHHSSMPYKNCS